MTFEDFKALVYRTYGNSKVPPYVVRALDHLEKQPTLSNTSEKSWYERLKYARDISDAPVLAGFIINRSEQSDE